VNKILFYACLFSLTLSKWRALTDKSAQEHAISADGNVSDGVAFSVADVLLSVALGLRSLAQFSLLIAGQGCGLLVRGQLEWLIWITVIFFLFVTS